MTSRYIRHSCNPPSLDDYDQLHDAKSAILAALQATLPRVLRHDSRSHNRSRGIYTGLSGIALLSHRLSKLAGSEYLFDELSESILASVGDEALSTCLKDLSSSGRIRHQVPSRISFLETDVGVATLVLLRVLETEGPFHRSPFFINWGLCFQVVRGAADSVSNHEEDACEVLYGRAGLVYALLLIRGRILGVGALGPDITDEDRWFYIVLKSLVSDEVLRSVVDSIIEIGREGALLYNMQLKAGSDALSPSLMWSWHGKRYLGAAHGVAGILHVLWNCPFPVLEPYANDMIKTLDWLVDLQDSTGNWPSKAPDNCDNARHDNELLQWCHGASGIILLLSKTSQQRSGIILNQHLHQKVDTAIEKGARLIYRHGLLKKGIGICHGVAGSVYALLAASQVLDRSQGGALVTDGAAKYLRKALHLAVLAVDYEEFTEKGEMRVPDRPWSLYEGAAGMCSAWVDVVRSLTGREAGGVPAFDDL